jgi:glucose-6-phosphate-specific signal transduction histidine kinase
VKLKGLQDRVAALDGHIHVTRNNRTSRVDLELPVVSLATPCAAPMNGADT